MKTLLLTKQTGWCQIAERFVSTHLPDVTICRGNVGEALPPEASAWSGDVILSFVSPWIVPGALLAQARIAALNFHPGPPEYPGIGCYNFALYHEEEEYGITCHSMATKVDTGAVIRVRRFPVLSRDTVESLKDRSMVAMLDVLFEVVGSLSRGEILTTSDETWTRRPYTRRELNELGRISADMPPAEIRRRVRAMHYPEFPGAFVELGGVRFRAE